MISNEPEPDEIEVYVYSDGTNEDWIREIVNNYGADLYRTGLVHELAVEVTSRLAEAYEQGRRDEGVDQQIENR